MDLISLRVSICWNQLIKIAKNPNGPTIIYVTHHVEEILPVFTKTLLLKAGQVFSSGNTDEMISSEILSRFFDLPVDVYWKNGRPMLSRLQSIEK